LTRISLYPYMYIIPAVCLSVFLISTPITELYTLSLHDALPISSLRISPLHVEFHSPLLYSSYAVSNDRLWLSHKISHQTYITACEPFTPNNSGQRLPPTYYRGCWHVVSRGFLVRYRQGSMVLAYYLFFPYNRVLRTEILLH